MIIYQQNPLRTTVMLDQHETKELWYKIKIEQMMSRVWGAHFHLTENKLRYINLGLCGVLYNRDEYFNLARAREEVDPNYYESNDDNEKSPLDKWTDRMLHVYVTELQGPHIGDCTCMAASCFKCHAETLLGIDTMPGLTCHPAYRIECAFNKTNDINEAIEQLINYTPKVEGGWEEHAKRWKKESDEAAKWLTAYRDAHFPL